MTAERINILDYDRPRLRGLFESMGEKPFRADQIMKWVYQRGANDFSAMTDLGKSLRAQLSEVAEIRLPDVISEQLSADGTRKWLFRLTDGNAVETVYIPEEDRGTLCVSSQVGCTLNCTFCATARQGFNRNLSTAEIIGQLWLADHLLDAVPGGRRTITNVVMMGMGEPLLNFDAVTAAMRLMLDDMSFGLSRRRVTLSTAGVVPALDKLKNELPVALAVSLHAPNDELRNQLVPLNRKYPISELLDACWRYVGSQNRVRVTVEYVMLDGVNDQPAHAQQLVELLRDKPVKINLIPFNSVPGIDYRCSSKAAINAFRDRLLAANIMTVTRKTRGSDIAAACGQLAGQVQDRTNRRARLENIQVPSPQ